MWNSDSRTSQPSPASPRLLDTIPSFLAYAKRAGPEAPWLREDLWEKQYRSAHPEVFEAYAVHQGEPALGHLSHRLYTVRQRVEQAASLWPAILEEAEPRVRTLLGAEDVASPLHVLMVGTFTTNAFVGRLGSEPAVFWCLEWFSNPEAARVLVAHETAHAFHQELLGAAPPDNDLAWTCLFEGLAVQASREAFPGRPEEEYFWYGMGRFEDWLTWCREHRADLLAMFRRALEEEDPGAVETFFEGGEVEGHWRTGFFVADHVVSALRRPLGELARLNPDEARRAIREGLAFLA